MKSNYRIFVLALILVSLRILPACENQPDLSDHSESTIFFERVGRPDSCLPLRTAEGDEIFLEFKRFMSENRRGLIGEGKSVWRIYGPLQCGDNVLFSAKKDLRIENGRIYLEVGAHFTVNYHRKAKKFEIIGGK